NAAGVGRCINPDHPDSTPSMGVYPDPLGGHLHCFGCGLHLDAYQYLVDVRGLSPRMALDTLEPGREPPSARPTRPRRAPPTPVRAPEVKACASQPLPERVQAVHDARVA